MSSLAESAQRLHDAAVHGEAIVPLLRRLCPGICRQIARNRRTPALFRCWGRSVNRDENTGTLIVHPAIVKALGQLADVPVRGPFVNAGLMHTYAYLLSVIPTPYGFKRDRWVSTHLENGFGLETSLLGESPRQGTLLANATWLFGHLALRGSPRGRRRIEAAASGAARAIQRFDGSALAGHRITEIVPGIPKVMLQTDLVPFPYKPAAQTDEAGLLVYSVRVGSGPLRLVTAFPIRPEAMETLLSAGSGKADVRLRYNAYVPSLLGKIVSGKRTVEG